MGYLPATHAGSHGNGRAARFATGGAPATKTALWNFCSQRVLYRKPAKTNKNSHSTDVRNLFAN